MKAFSLDLQEVYNDKLRGLLAAEKRYIKCFRLLSSAAYTGELKSGLSPAGMDQEQHIERLRQCMVLQKLKAVNTIQELDESLLQMAEQARGQTKKPSIFRDIPILHCSQAILNVKITYYQSLLLMAAALQQENVVLLLEQSFKDNQNAYNYLVQIACNIIYPKAKSEYVT